MLVEFSHLDQYFFFQKVKQGCPQFINLQIFLILQISSSLRYESRPLFIDHILLSFFICLILFNILRFIDLQSSA